MNRIYGFVTSSACEQSCSKLCTLFFVIRHVNREILHIAVTPCPTAEWTVQQLVECCAWDRWPPRFLFHDRDSWYGATFEHRLRHLGIEQVRTPFRAPLANAISERWVKSVRTEYLDHSSSARAICVEPFRRMSHILAVGARMDRSVNARHVIRQSSTSELARPTARLSQSRYSAGCITFISMRHDGLYFCALRRCRADVAMKGLAVGERLISSTAPISTIRSRSTGRVRLPRYR
jgi:hypothetical protein